MIIKDIAEYEDTDSQLAKYTILKLHDEIYKLKLDNKTIKRWYRLCKSRNEKAIEYVKYELYILGIRDNRKQQDELLNILQGEDKE